MIQQQRRGLGFLAAVVAAIQVVEKQMKVPSIVTLQMSVHLLVHPKAQNFPISNVQRCSHFPHSPTDLLQVVHLDAHSIRLVVVARTGSDCCPSALPTVIWEVMASIPLRQAFVVRGLPV
jgi:hypothetical protein